MGRNLIEICHFGHAWSNICLWVHRSSSLVLCSKAGSRHPVSPTFSIQSSTLNHFIGLIGLDVIQHHDTRLSSSSLPFHPSFNHFFTRLSPLKMCLSHRFYLSNAVFKSFLLSFTRSNTYSLVMWPFQLMLSIFRQVQISKAFNLSLSYFRSVQVSDPYNAIHRW